jgi:hypothetical protein
MYYKCCILLVYICYISFMSNEHILVFSFIVMLFKSLISWVDGITNVVCKWKV